MYSIKEFARLVRESRRAGGWTQRAFAEQIGTSQSAVASLEAGDGNPTIETLARCAAASGFVVEIALVPAPPRDPVIERYRQDVDRSLLRANLRLSVHERIARLAAWQQDLGSLSAATATASAAARRRERLR